MLWVEGFENGTYNMYWKQANKSFVLKVTSLVTVFTKSSTTDFSLELFAAPNMLYF